MPSRTKVTLANSRRAQEVVSETLHEHTVLSVRGVPVDAPASGQLPLALDTLTNRLYVYANGVWNAT